MIEIQFCCNGAHSLIGGLINNCYSYKFYNRVICKMLRGQKCVRDSHSAQRQPHRRGGEWAASPLEASSSWRWSRKSSRHRAQHYQKCGSAGACVHFWGDGGGKTEPRCKPQDILHFSATHMSRWSVELTGDSPYSISPLYFQEIADHGCSLSISWLYNGMQGSIIYGA